MERRSALARPIAAAAAGALGFALAAGYFLLSTGPFEGLPFLALFVAVPAALVALMPFLARLFWLGLGLLSVVGASFLDVGGPDNPMSVFPFVAIGVTSGVVLAEACVRAVERILSPGAAGSSRFGAGP